MVMFFFRMRCQELTPPPPAVSLDLLCFDGKVGIASTLGYRDVKGIDAYIPLINVPELTDPLLAIDVNDLPEK